MRGTTRFGSGRAFRWGASVLGLLTLSGVWAPAPGWAQTAPTRFDVSPSQVEQGDCYTIDVGTPDITLDVKYRFNSGPAITLVGWPSVGSDGTVEICTNSTTAPGVYTFVEARNTLGGPWVSGGDTLTVTAPPPPDFTLTAYPSPQYVAATGSADYTVGVMPQNGFNEEVSLSVSGLPSNVTGTFSPASVTAPYNTASTLTVRSAGASLGTATLTLTGTGGGLSKTAAVNLTVVAQPSSFSMVPSTGYAGVDSFTATAGNGANMDLELQFTLNGAALTGTIPLDAMGQWPYDLAHDTPDGTYVYTAMRNALVPDWVAIDPNVTYTVYPPKPTSLTVDPSSVVASRNYTMTVGNGAGVTLDTWYKLKPWGSNTYGPETLLPSWPSLASAGGSSPDDGTAVIETRGCTPPGEYRFTKIRNSRHPDPSQEDAWTAVTSAVTVSGPVAVTQVTPSHINVGTSVEVTLTGEHLCALTLSTSRSGVTLSELMFDDATGEGTTATVRVTVTAAAATGAAWVNVIAGEGSTSFPLTIDPPPTFRLTAYPSPQYVAATGSADYRVRVRKLYGFDEEVSLSVNGLPSNVEGEFSSESSSSSSITASTLTVTSAGASLGTTTLTLTGTGGGLSKTEVVDLTVVAQPSSFSIDPSAGEAGVDSFTVTVGNGADMNLDLQYTLNEAARTGTIPLDANGQFFKDLARDTPAGTYVYTAMRNALVSDWVAIDPNVTHTVDPPKPTSLTVDPSSFVTPGNYTMMVGNGAGMTLDVQYELKPPDAPEGTEELRRSWPSLASAGGSSPDDGTAVIEASGCMPPGEYRFTKIRNSRYESASLDDASWTEVNAVVTLSSPVAVTGVTPSHINVGTSVDVTLTGEHLCALTLETSHPGVTLSDLVFDDESGAGTTATVRVTVAAAAAIGVATVDVIAGEGSTSFPLTIDPPPDFTMTAAPGTQYVEPTGSAAYTVSVTPLYGFNQEVSLSMSGLPANITGTFSPASLTAPYNTTSTLRVTSAGAAPGTTATLTLTGTGGGVSKTAAVDLTVLTQPSSFSIDPSAGEAGRDSFTVTVGDGADMNLDLQYTLNGAALTGNIPLDANGEFFHDLAHDTPAGTYVYTAMKNALMSDWVAIDPHVTYTVYPPKPTSLTVDPSSFVTPEKYTMTVGNGAGMTLDVQYTRTPPGETNPGPVEAIENWPELASAGGSSPDDGTAVIEASGCTPPGEYRFTKIRNSRYESDSLDDASWTEVNAVVTLSSPVAVTGVVPSHITAGTATEVRLTGEHLCALTLSTSQPGVTLSDLIYRKIKNSHFWCPTTCLTWGGSTGR